MPGSETKKARDRERMRLKRAKEKRFIDSVEDAYAAYLIALLKREHGGVAAHRMVDAVAFVISDYDHS